MTSTAEDHPSNLIISIEHEYLDSATESAVMNHFKAYLGLEKKKEKAKGRKQCLDWERGDNHDYKCSANNMNKVLNLKQQ